MFFGRPERKKHNGIVILTVGALAAIGAISITRSGKNMLCELKCKVKNLFKKESACCEKKPSACDCETE